MSTITCCAGKTFAAVVAIVTLLHGAAVAQSSVKIGYAVSKTGRNASEANTNAVANYELWVREVNAGGGLKLGNERVPIEVVQYDDHSKATDAAKAIDHLIKNDKVDFILSPWGAEFNLAAAPILERAGFPYIAGTTQTDRAPELTHFVLLGSTADASTSLVELLQDLRQQGKIGDTVAMVSVSDTLSEKLAEAARPALRDANFKLSFDETYPVGTQDFRSIIKKVQAADPDVFIAFSYPPDTFGLVEQSHDANFKPKVFHAGFGTATLQFRQRTGAQADGVFGIGAWDGDNTAVKEYLARLKTAIGDRKPDRWASAVTYVGLQMLQQAIERVGKVDREAVSRELQLGHFETILGTMKLVNNRPTRHWWSGQWRGDQFHNVSHAKNTAVRAGYLPHPHRKTQ